MKAFSSLAGVVALWLGASFFIWLLYRLFRKRDGSRQIQLARRALDLTGEAGPVFRALRSPDSRRADIVGFHWRNFDDRGDTLQDDVRSLLNAIEAKCAYFDNVKATKTKIERAFGVEDFSPLSEILQIRRDFWAASEVFLIDDIRHLGSELVEVQSYEAFKAEALALLFKDRSAALPDGDPVELRLAIARDEAAAFLARVEETIAAGLEESRFPTPAEIVAVPLSVVRSAAFAVREGRTIVGDAAAIAQSFARSVGAKGLKAAAFELREARGDLPGQFASAFERAGGLARKGGEGLKRHYEFLLEAQELRARYAELLARAPIVTEKGKQFLARLELERRAEQLRETSGSAADWLRRRLVVAIAYLIAGLQFVQARITPQSNKQLAVRAPAAEPAESVSPEPLRVLLLPASSYDGGNHGRGRGRSETKKSRKTSPEARPFKEAPSWQPEPTGRLRDLVNGEATADRGASATESRPNAARRPSAKGSGSLLDRLSDMETGEQAGARNLPPEEEQKHRRFRVSKSK